MSVRGTLHVASLSELVWLFTSVYCPYERWNQVVYSLILCLQLSVSVSRMSFQREQQQVPQCPRLEGAWAMEEVLSPVLEGLHRHLVVEARMLPTPCSAQDTPQQGGIWSQVFMVLYLRNPDLGAYKTSF